MRKTLIIPLLLIGCIAGFILGGGYFYLNSNTHKEKLLTKNAYTDLVNGNYKAALAEYTELTKLDNTNPAFLDLKVILNSYLLAQNAFNKGDYSTSSNILNSINPSYKNYPIKNNIDKLKNISLAEETMLKAKALIKTNNFNEASNLLNSIDLSKLDPPLQGKINSLKNNLKNKISKMEVKK